MTSYSLSELLRAVQTVVRAEFTDTYWVRAEVSSLSARPGSHCYMELVESAPGSNELFTAKIRANCWRSTWTSVSALFEDVAGQPLRAGMQILAEVSLDFHPIYGMSLTIEHIDPTFTIGDLSRQKQEVLRRLEKEGYIKMYTTIVDADKIDRGFTVFCNVSFKQINRMLTEEFRKQVDSWEEVTECYNVSGDSDFVMKVSVSGMKEYQTFILNKVGVLDYVGRIQSIFVLENLKISYGVRL